PWGYWYANNFERKILDEDSLKKLLEVLLPKGTELKQENFPLNIRNYFQNPKKNGYKSFHINLALPSGEGGNILGMDMVYVLPFIEMQVLNMKAYKNNELGSASHKIYKKDTLGSELRESLKKLYETLIPCNVFTDGGRGRKEAYVEVITVLLKEAIEQHSQKYQSLRLTYP
ncbi:MAG: hypothetical protein GXN99_00920, partial [Candidatus Nanohaloarchaeota archaeon]|nr:hypothetical protein [Candidatus Nanohaloarchaeota archaeon]